MTSLNMLDLGIISMTVISAVIGLIRGAVKETMTLITWVVASIVSIKYGVLLGNYFTSVSTELVRNVIGGLIVFVIILIIGGIVNMVISKIVRMSHFVVMDKLFGCGLGVLRSIVIVLIVLPIVTDLCIREEWWQSSVLIPKMQIIFEYVKQYIPEDDLRSITDVTNKFILSETKETQETK